MEPLAQSSLTGRARTADRISKLEAITVANGASPSEAEFAARHARFLRTQLTLGDRRSGTTTITFRSGVNPGPTGSPAPGTAPARSVNAPAVVAAYGARRGERRRKAALRFVELA
jgi:hypothetical protein